jgi:uncharacterized protein
LTHVVGAEKARPDRKPILSRFSSGSRSYLFICGPHNSEKIRARHGVTPAECEQVFFNQPIILGDDVKHSTEENRLYLLGRTEARRLLFLVFTVRDELIRVISARDMNKKERRVYQAHEEEDSPVQE